ncbi:MAG: HAD family phosphatase [archaeon]
MKKITTLIFDWGGVFTTGKFTQCILEVLASRRKITISEVYADFDRVLMKMARGALSFSQFVRTINTTFGWNYTPTQMSNAFYHAIRPYPPMISLIQRFKKKYRLIMLSDNDPMTVKNIRMHHPTMLAPFDQTFFSFQVNYTKPDKRFFKHVLAKTKSTVQECVFIDDKQKNVDAAKELGINGIQYTSIGKFKKDLKKLGVIT